MGSMVPATQDRDIKVRQASEVNFADKTVKESFKSGDIKIEIDEPKKDQQRRYKNNCKE